MPLFLLRAPAVRLCMGLACVLSLWNTVSGIKEEAKKEKGMTFLPITVSGSKGVKKEGDGALLGATVSVLRGEEKKEKGVAFLATTEVPARSVDLSSLNLTELVNGMLSRALKDSKKFFSLLTVTSYSSFAFHKLSVAIYNISNLKTVDLARFSTRYCYCLNNQTNDLSDFTALLVDIIGNSTGYLTEIFKSTSILSVSQTNESDCVFICVMAGKAGKNLSDFWEMAEKSPVINYTFTSSLPGAPGAATWEIAGTPELTTQSQQTPPGTSPPLGAWSTHLASAARTSPWTDTTAPSGEVTGTTGRVPEPPTRATASWNSASPSLPASATRRVVGTHGVTTNTETGASTLSALGVQTSNEKMPGGPPWEAGSSTPPAEAQEAMDAGSHQAPAEIMALPSSAAQPSLSSGMATPGTQTPSPTKAPAPKDPQTGSVPAARPFTLGDKPAQVPTLHHVSRCPQPLLKEGAMTAAPLTLAIQKLNPCLMELCRFFQQCLCMSQRRPRMEVMRFCLEYYSWFLKNATLICQRVKRVSHSRTLKQKCLENICRSV